MSIQDTYSETIRPGVVGHIYDMVPKALISRNVEDAAGIGFGKVVQIGARDEGCTADLNTTAMTAQRFLGITARDRSLIAETDKFSQYESARIVRKGGVWVNAGAAVAPSDIVTVTLATGVIGKTAVDTGVVAIPNAKWESTTSAAGLAKLRLD